MDLEIEEIKYSKNIKLKNISEYEFELLKINTTLKSGKEVEMYLKMVKRTKIKESIFCYWCSIYEEEIIRKQEMDDETLIINKVLISELEKTKYQKRIFLTIENNRTSILEAGTEVNFIEIMDYIKENKTNRYEKLKKYFDEQSNDTLLVGIKINRMNP